MKRQSYFHQCGQLRYVDMRDSQNQSNCSTQPKKTSPFISRRSWTLNSFLSSKWRGVSPLPSLGTVLDSLPSHGSSYLLIVNNKLPLLPSHPVSGWTSDLVKYVAPFAPPPLQGLQHYYEAIRHRERASLLSALRFCAFGIFT